jgi:GNAT superfamily N-acetyltransferase
MLGHELRHEAGARGPDYEGLTFTHDDDGPFEYANREGERYHRINAFHPEHGRVGGIGYTVTPDEKPGKKYNETVRVSFMSVPPEHQRRGVASKLMDELQRVHPNARINHGKRTFDGEMWAHHYFGEGMGRTRNGRTAVRRGKEFPRSILESYAREHLPQDVGHGPEGDVVTNGNKRLKALERAGFDWPIPVRTGARNSFDHEYPDDDVWYHASHSEQWMPRGEALHVGTGHAAVHREDSTDVAPTFLHRLRYRGRAFTSPEDPAPDYVANHAYHEAMGASRSHSDPMHSDNWAAMRWWHQHDGGPNPEPYVKQHIEAARRGEGIHYANFAEGHRPTVSLVAPDKDFEHLGVERITPEHRQRFAAKRVTFDQLAPHEQQAAALYHDQMKEEGFAHPDETPHDYAPSDIHPYHFIKRATVVVEHRHWGGGLESLFPSDEDGPRSVAAVPWQQAGMRKDRKTYDENLVARSITHPHEFPIEDVDPRDLRATQPKVIRAGVKHYMENPERTYGEDNGGDRRLGNDVPRIYHREDGQKIILSGHHRAAAALLKGEPLKAMVIHGGWGEERRRAA